MLVQGHHSSFGFIKGIFGITSTDPRHNCRRSPLTYSLLTWTPSFEKQDESQLTRLTGDFDDLDLDNDHELKTAPLLTRGAYRTKKVRQAIGQYGVFGTITESRYDESNPKMSFHPLICVGYP